MPYIEAVLLTRWIQDSRGISVPSVLSDIYAWARANDEHLPGGAFGRYQDLTGQADVHQRILDNLAVSIAKVEMTLPTAQHFASDPRIWTLGYSRRDDEGDVIDSNWDTTLTTAERQQAANYVTANSAITAQQLANAFEATDTRREIAQKLKTFFRETA